MAIVDDIFSILRKGNEARNDINDLLKYNTQSLAKRASNSTLQFPCLIGNDIPIAMASAVTRNMDLVYASFVQTVVSADPMIDISIDRSPLDYMKRLHQNLKLESVIFESALHSKDEELQEMKTFLESECPNVLIPEDLEDTYLEGAYKGEYKLFLDPTGSYGVAFTESKVTPDIIKSNQEGLKQYLNQFDLRPFPTMEAERGDVAAAILQNTVDASERDKRDFNLKYSDKLNNSTKLLDRDVKKSNDIQPYALQVRLMAVNDKKEFVQFIDFIMGVKAIMHPVKADELLTNITYVLQNKNPVFNFIKWTTGEISLIKDLLLHLDEIKFDVTYKNRGNSAWIPTLKRMKEKKVGIKRLMLTKLVPNATMVVSSFIVDEVKRKLGMDLRDVYFAKKIISELFLLSFIIVDEGTETVEILYEGSTSFETYALETLERQVSMSSNRLGKEIGRMISQ